MWSAPQRNSPIVQRVEHLTVNQGVVGSSPTRGANGRLVKRLRHRPFTAVSGVRFPHRSPFGRLAQLGERLPYKQNVSGSIPLAPTMLNQQPSNEGCFFIFKIFLLRESLLLSL